MGSYDQQETREDGGFESRLHALNPFEEHGTCLPHHDDECPGCETCRNIFDVIFDMDIEAGNNTVCFCQTTSVMAGSTHAIIDETDHSGCQSGRREKTQPASLKNAHTPSSIEGENDATRRAQTTDA